MDSEVMDIVWDYGASGQGYEEKVYKADSKTISSFDELKVMLDDGVLAFDQLPLLQIDGVNVVQKMAAVRHLARKHNMYGADNAEATQCDIIMESLLDFKNGLKRDDIVGSCAKLLEKYGPRLERVLNSNTAGGKKFLVGNGLTFVDIVLFDLLVTAKEYGVDLSPHGVLAAYLTGIEALPRIAAYIASPRRYPSPGLPGYYDRVKATMPWLFGEGAAPEMSNSIWVYRSTDCTK